MNRPLVAPAQDLASMLSRTVATYPERAATIENAGPRTAVTSFAELSEQVDLARQRLAAHGVGRGDRVAFWAENRREFLVWQFAAAAAGVTLVGVNTRYRVQELAHVLEQARPRLVVMPQRLLALDLVGLLHEATTRLRTESPEWPVPQVAVLAPSDGPPRTAGHDTTLDAHDVGAGSWWADEHVDHAPDVAPGRPTDLGMTFTTSGSTGLPKLAAHDQAALSRHAATVAVALDLRAGDVVCCALPLTGVFS